MGALKLPQVVLGRADGVMTGRKKRSEKMGSQCAMERSSVGIAKAPGKKAMSRPCRAEFPATFGKP
jgi:hypothetical protein